MPIENIMYFALGALASALLALVILPAVWRRAVRLTRHRIEAATPMTLAEFRADKDQLRSEFALAIRRLEQQNSHLRTRLAEELGDSDRQSTELVTLRAAQDTQANAIRDLEERLVQEQERLAERDGQIADLTRQAEDYVNGTGSPDEVAALRERIAVLEAELAVIAEARPDLVDIEPAMPIEAILTETAGVSIPESPNDAATDTAEADIAMAESRLNSIFEADAAMPDGNESLVERLNREDRIEQLHGDIAAFEATVTHGREPAQADAVALRKQLLAIAQSVGTLVRGPAAEPETDDSDTESLFARVQRFAEEDLEFAGDADEPDRQRERRAAAREIQGR